VKIEDIIESIQNGLIQDGITYNGVTYPIKQHGGLRFAPESLHFALGLPDSWASNPEVAAIDELIAGYIDQPEFDALTAEELVAKYYAE
jgi:hypothetical protein